MPVFAVYVPDGDLTDAARAARVEFVKEGFSLWAFLLPPLYFLVHRAWIALVLSLAGMVLVNGIAAAVGAPPWAVFLSSLAFSFLIGMEANGLRQWSLEQRGLRLGGSVVARDLDEAEQRFFGALIAGPGGVPGAVLPARMTHPPVAPGAFLFQETGPGR